MLLSIAIEGFVLDGLVGISVASIHKFGRCIISYTACNKDGCKTFTKYVDIPPKVFFLPMLIRNDLLFLPLIIRGKE
jgi:hypothetical protein